MLILSVLASALAADPQVLETSDPAYTMNDLLDAHKANQAFIEWESTQPAYDFVVGAGAGAVDWNGSVLTLPILTGIFNQGPSGFTLDSAGHFRDGTVAIDRYVWFMATKVSDGRKYFVVLTDRTITGDADPVKWGAWHAIWSARYVQAPGAGIVWPSQSEIANVVEDHVTMQIVKVENGLAGKSTNNLITIAKANCANVYGATACNAKTWKHIGQKYVIFPKSGGMTLSDWATSHPGTYYAHHPADTLTTYADAGSWLLILLGGCFSDCNSLPTGEQACNVYCNTKGISCAADGCVCTFGPANEGCPAKSCRAADDENIIASDWAW